MSSCRGRGGVGVGRVVSVLRRQDPQQEERPPAPSLSSSTPNVPFLLSFWDAVVMVVRGSRARGTSSLPALVWLSRNTFSVRNSKILQVPLPSCSVGAGKGRSKNSPYSFPAPPQRPPMYHRLPTSLGPFPLPSGALHLRTLRKFLVKPYSFLCQIHSSACLSVPISSQFS